jgi:hypothetical protein
MWSDVVIGEGEKLCSATTVFGVENVQDISENRTAYWISDAFLGLGATIYKSSPEGQHLKKLFDDKVDSVVIYRWLHETILANISADKLVDAIEDAKSAAFSEGRKSAQAEMRRALGLR